MTFSRALVLSAASIGRHCYPNNGSDDQWHPSGRLEVEPGNAPSLPRMRWFSAVTMRSISMTLRDRGRAALLLCGENLNGNNHRSGTRLEVPPRTRNGTGGPTSQ